MAMQIEALKRVQLPVLSHRGRWLICFRGKRAEFIDRASALREAAEPGYDCCINGCRPEGMCVADSLTREVVWPYGIAPDPPAALRREAPRGRSDRRGPQPLPPASRAIEAARW